MVPATTQYSQADSMDPISITTTVIALATCLKDIVKIAKEIRSRIEKVCPHSPDSLRTSYKHYRRFQRIERKRESCQKKLWRVSSDSKNSM